MLDFTNITFGLLSSQKRKVRIYIFLQLSKEKNLVLYYLFLSIPASGKIRDTVSYISHCFQKIQSKLSFKKNLVNLSLPLAERWLKSL